MRHHLGTSSCHRPRPPRAGAVLLVLAGALGAPAGLAGCASDGREPTGEVIRTDEIARREREGYDLARQAAAAERAGNPDRAIELYSQAVGVWPEIPSAWNNMGLLLMDKSNYMEAVEAFKTAARQNVTDPRPLINVGVAYDRTGWADEALAAYLQALERAPTDRDALLGAITANHRLLGGDRAALDRVKTALLIEPDPAVREWLERERFRIEAKLTAVAQDAPVIPTPARPAPSTPVNIAPRTPATGP